MEKSTRYPYIFLDSTVDYLTLIYDSVSELKQSDFLVKSAESFNFVFSYLVNNSMRDFLTQIYLQMNKFYGFSLKEFMK
jgi:hypothetical protein